jgi:hypothetical protein
MIILTVSVLNQFVNDIRHEAHGAHSTCVCKPYVPIEVDNINLADTRAQTDLSPVSAKSDLRGVPEPCCCRPIGGMGVVEIQNAAP